MNAFARACLLCSTVVVLALPVAAHAQAATPAPAVQAHVDPSGTTPAPSDDIVVTAQLRRENLQNVPLSVSVISGDQLNRTGIVRFQDLGTSVPNFSISANPTSDTISLRGINSAGQSGSEQPVAVYVDGIYRGRGVQSRFAFLDIDRIEVLRGPQGTLFGRNTIAGAVNITTGQPTDTPDVSLQTLYEFNNREVDVRGHIAGPITNTLSGRVAFLYDYLGRGWDYNSATGQYMPQIRNWAARGSLAWKPTDVFSVTARYEHGSVNQDGSPIELKVVGPSLKAAAGLFGLSVEPNLDGRTNITNANEPVAGLKDPPQFQDPVYLFKAKSDEASARADLDLGFATASAIGGYSFYDFRRTQDADFSPVPAVQARDQENFRQYSGELRLASSDKMPFYYLIGAYYQHEQLRSFTDAIPNYSFLDAFTCLASARAPGCTALAGFAPGLYTRSRLNPQISKTWAVFAQATYKPFDTVELTAGLRYGENHKRATQSTLVYAAATDQVVAEPVPGLFRLLPTETTPHVFTDLRTINRRLLPQVSARWEFAPNVNLYARFARGTQDGGFNQFYGGTDRSAASFLPEDSDDYELGLKTQLADRRITLNANLYDVEFRGLQTTQFTGSTSYIVANAASARARGVEFDARVHPFEQLTVTASGAYNDFRFKSFRTAGCTAGQLATGNNGAAFANAAACATAGTNDLSGRTNQNAPKFTFNINAAFAQPIGKGARLTLSGEAQHTSSFYAATNLDPNLLQQAYTKYNAALTLSVDDGRFEVGVVGRNLSNERTFFYGNNTPLFSGSFQVAIERSRTIAFRTAYKF